MVRGEEAPLRRSGRSCTAAMAEAAAAAMELAPTRWGWVSDPAGLAVVRMRWGDLGCW